MIKFSSTSKAVQHLADLTRKRIIVYSGKIITAKDEKELKIDWFDSGADMEISIHNQSGDVVGSIWREYPDKHKDDWTLRLPGQKRTISGTLPYCLEKVMKSGQQLALRVHPRMTKAEGKNDSHNEEKPQSLEFEFGVEDSELLSKTKTTTMPESPSSIGGWTRAPI